MSPEGTFHSRITIEQSGKRIRSTRKLASTTKAAAIQEHNARLVDHRRSKLGLCEDPFATVRKSFQIQELADAYFNAGCPNRAEERRTGKDLLYTVNRINLILRYFGRFEVSEVTPKVWKAYRDWRSNQCSSGTGDRSVDYDRVALSCLIDWAYCEELVTTPSPFNRNFTKFAKAPEHSREKRPKDADELHRIANYFFRSPKSEVLGFQFLFECLTGCRTNEILSLSFDAKGEKQPGHVEHNHLWINRNKGGVNNFVELFPELKSCMEAHINWHNLRHPESPWWFPSPRMGGRSHVDKCALSHALKRACGELGIDEIRTSHGCRAYRACVLLNSGMDPGTVAMKLGQRSGAKLIIEVYGEATPNPLGYKPTSEKVCWEQWLPLVTTKGRKTCLQ